LSLEWGLISDIDADSEKLRFLGNWRFDIMGGYKAVFGRKERQAIL
jgi:hypothetical protein